MSDRATLPKTFDADLMREPEDAEPGIVDDRLDPIMRLPAPPAPTLRERMTALACDGDAPPMVRETASLAVELYERADAHTRYADSIAECAVGLAERCGR